MADGTAGLAQRLTHTSGWKQVQATVRNYLRRLALCQKKHKDFTAKHASAPPVALDGPYLLFLRRRFAGMLLRIRLFYFRRGRRTNSPPQFGQTLFISAAHFSQKVHS
jgi:hypothetical protein